MESKYNAAKKSIEEKGYTLVTKKFDPTWTKLTILDMKCLKNHDKKTSLATIIKGSDCKQCKKDNDYARVTEEFVKIGYKLLSTEYVSSSTLLQYECDKGHENAINYYKFNKGIRCNKCIKKPRPTYESVKKEFEEVGYKLISTKYVKAIAKLDFECDKGHITKIRYNDLQQGSRCGKCNGTYQCTYDEVVQIYVDRGYELLSLENEYKSVMSILKFKCDQGHSNETTLSAIKNGRKCSICTGNKKLTYDFVKDQFKEKGYTLITPIYTNARTIMKFKCDDGDHNHQMTYSDIKQGKRCAKCVGGVRLAYDVVQKAFHDIEYILISTEYKNAHQKLKYICDKNHENEINYDHFKGGRRCSKCSESNGEKAISEYLKKCDKVITYDSEKTFDDCKNIRRLPFDFCVSTKYHKFLIEYDGAQHFESVEFFGGEKALISTQKRDKIKTDYCRKERIPLLRISYRQFKEIDNLIERFIHRLDEADRLNSKCRTVRSNSKSKTPKLIEFSDQDLYSHLVK
jgi:hypothetical protein